MFIESFPVGPFQCNCSILACENSQEAIIIDPGEEAERIIQSVERQGFKIKYLLHTHAHLDHVGATYQVQQKLGGQACLHEEDMFLFEHVPMQAALFNLSAPPTGKIDLHIHDGDKIHFGEHNIEIFHTPGHTPGSVSFYLEANKLLFTGDTLFFGSIGRTDLWGGDYAQILRSIKNKILPLDGDVKVCPGHGPTSSVAREKNGNPFLQG